MRHLFFTLIALFTFILPANASDGEENVVQGERLAAKGETATSLLILNHFIDRYATMCKTRKDSLLLLRAYTQNAANYQTLGNDQQTIMYCRKAIDIAKATGERKRLARLYNSVFGIYYTQHEYSRAEDLLKASLEINMAEGDSAAIRSNYNNFGLVCYERGDLRKALAYLDQALDYTPHNDRAGMSLVLTNRAEFYLRQKLFVQAEHELQRALDIQKGCSYAPQLVQTSLNMALVKARLGKRHEVMQMQKKLYDDIQRMPLPMQSNSYEELADVHFILGDSLAALRDILKYHQINDSLRQMSNNEQLQQLLVAYDTERLRQHNSNLQQTVELYRLKVDKRTMLVYGVVIFLVILSSLLGILIRRMRIDKAKNRLIQQQQQQLLVYEQRERKREQAEQQRKQQELSLEIDHKNRQLTSYTLDMATVNEFHQRISQNLNKLHSILPDMTPDADTLLKDTVKDLQHFNDKPLGNDFHTYFDEVHPGFLQRLSERFPLSKTDLRLCAYLHLGMTTKEISALTFKEVRSVESSRNRLRKKLNLPPETNLQDFLKQFDKV